MRTSYCVGGVLLSVAVVLLVAAARRPAESARNEDPRAKVNLSGEAAHDYLTQSEDGRSLMQALQTARFGLSRQEHAPLDRGSGAGYLAVSHDQNLNAWFAEDGVTIRPTVSEKERDEAWQLGFKLKGYGYGADLQPAPPIVRQTVKGDRIEYARAALPAAAETDSPQLIEWYVNRAEGIEQGFTLAGRPERSSAVTAPEPLRVSLEVTGDLRAQVKEEGQEIELVDARGEGTLSYRKLIAIDAAGKQLVARMEASADGREIALVVDDREAVYPLVIDPITASLEKALDAGGNRQTDARFGFAVAIYGGTAVVGAWREDIPSTVVDAGAVYMFTRSGSGWSSATLLQAGDQANANCGWSVAIHLGRVAFGCPGANNQAGRGFLRQLSPPVVHEFILPSAPNVRDPGDQFGYSVALSNETVVVGAPTSTRSASANVGQTFIFELTANSTPVYRDYILGSDAAQCGHSVAIENETLLVGCPTATVFGSHGMVAIHQQDSNGTWLLLQRVKASDAQPGDSFGNSVDISGKIMVVGAPGDDDRDTDAGAAYVFTHDGGGCNHGVCWVERQKLTAGDGRADDRFGEHAVAVDGNTIVVGATGWDLAVSGDNAGAAYIFMRSGTVWSLQTALNGKAAENLGISVDIEGDTVIAGARGADAGGTARAGAAYVYRLDCVPPYDAFVVFPEDGSKARTFCPGSYVGFGKGYRFGVVAEEKIQWRKNGAPIPGATYLNFDIASVSTDDAGSYDFIVSNSCGSDISNSVVLSLHTFALNPTSGNFSASGSSGIVNITSTGSCPWTATSNVPWITINSGSSGKGNGTVGFTVAATNSEDQRTGTITIGGRVFTVTQDGLKCAYAIAPTEQSVGANGGANSINVTVTPGCAWSAASNAPFININSAVNQTGSGVLNYSVEPNRSPTERSGTLTVAGQTVTVRQAAAALLGNISTRLRVERGDDALIGGFIVTGNQQKRLMLRAIGPSLPVEEALADPQLQIFNSTGDEIAFNNNWRDATNRQEIIDSSIAPSNELESAILREFAPGAYTAVVRGIGDTTGVGLIEAYDLGQGVDAKLANISTRGLVQRDANVMIGGFFVLGAPQKVIVRAIGPSLDVNGRLEDPLLELFNGNGDSIASNNNWRDTQQAEIEATTIPPSNDLEAAIVTFLPAGPYTAVVRGVNDTTGVALVEVYALQ